MDLTLKNNNYDSLDVAERRSLILSCERACKEQESETGIHLEPSHYHCEGIYARELNIPKGCALVGEIHKHPQINVVSAGHIRVLTEDGVREIKAPCTFISPAGTKRVGYALEDTTWTVFHATNDTDQKVIREQFIASNYDKLDAYLNKPLEDSNDVGSDSSDGSNHIVHSGQKESSREEST